MELIILLTSMLGLLQRYIEYRQERRYAKCAYVQVAVITVEGERVPRAKRTTHAEPASGTMVIVSISSPSLVVGRHQS